MKAYWDSSALVKAIGNPTLRIRLQTERGFTRTHALAEVFSTVTAGKLSIHLDADDAAQTVAGLLVDLDFVDLSASEVLTGLMQSKKMGVRGGRIHVLAAEKSGAQELLTSDIYEFTDLSKLLKVTRI